MRVKAVIAYDGSSFEGFQRQKRTKNTITTAIEDALKSLGITSQIVGSGRTDTRVHAIGQVIHFDLPPFWEGQSLQKLQTHLNQKLEAIRFRKIVEVSSSFHSRFDAKRRKYRYIFKRETPIVFERNYISHLEIESTSKLKEALSYFEGTYDFAMLSKSGSETKTTVRTIFKATVKRRKDYYLIYFEGDGFLRAQVRAMIALAMEFANSKITKEELKAQIEGKSRVVTKLAPPEGLYLVKIYY